MKNECLICNAPLEYLDADIVMECTVCHKKEMLDAVHTALINAIQIEDWDRFQRLYEIEDELFERSESKTDKFTMIEITMF